MLDPLQNEKNADLDVSEGFNIFNFSDPPQNEKNADLNVSEDFKIFNFQPPPQNEKNVYWDVSENFKIFKHIYLFYPCFKKIYVGPATK